MATFTFRIPDSMAGRLGSSEMRAWLTQFLRYPSLLPADLGPGSARISLTLPRELVRDVAGYLRCSPSIALRRVAAAHLNVQAAAKAASPYRSSPSIPIAAPKPITSVPRPSPGGGQTEPKHDNAAIGELAASAAIPILFAFLFAGGLIFLGTRQLGIPEST